MIAFYLPQFHPIPENDRWWGKGFTEWTNVVKARPLFRGHDQPQLPADLGFYDLRVPEIREAQADLARQYGVHGFCYWHYYFNGERLLERPFHEVLTSGRPDFPFCLGWANETWSGLWFGGDERHVLKEQTYGGREDCIRHFNLLRPAFQDPRYICVEGKPLFVIYKPFKIPDCRMALDCWREQAAKIGLPGLHIVAHLDSNERNSDVLSLGFDGVTIWPMRQALQARPCLWTAKVKRFLANRQLHRLRRCVDLCWPGRDRVYRYEEILPRLVCEGDMGVPFYPMAIPNWDTTARYDANAIG
jgi:lipopolysaccharide biosynthesis protein